MSEQDLQALGNLEYGVAGDTTDYVRVAQEGLDSVPPASSTGATDDSFTRIKATIMAFEGDGEEFDSNGNFVAYPDVYGEPTIAFGFTEGVSLGDTMTVEEAEERLDAEILRHRDFLFAEFATGVAFLRKGRNSSNVIDAEQFGFTGNDATEYQNNYGDGFQYDWTNNAEDYAPLPEGVTEPYVRVIKDDGKDYERFVTWDGETKTISGKGQTVFYGYRDREELLAVGESKYNALDEDTQTSLVSLVYNMGSLGPEVLSVANQVVETGNKLPLAEIISRMPEQYDKGVEGLEIRRNEEANIIKNGYSQRVADHAETGVLKKYGIENPFESTTSTTAPVVGESTTAITVPQSGGGRGRFPSSVGGFNVGRQMAQDAGLNDDDESNYLTQFLDNPLLEQYGGYGLFLDSNNLDFHIGIKGIGRGFVGGISNIIPVDINDPSAISSMHIVDYIQQMEILDDPARVEQLFTFTDYFQTTTSFQREFDTRFRRMSDPQKEEELLPARRMLEDLARQLGITYTDDELDEKSLFLARGNKVSDERFVKEFVMADKAQKETVGQYTELMSTERSIRANANNYYLNLNPDEITNLAEARFTGEISDAEILEQFAQRAVGLYPALARPVMELGIMPSDYFSTHKTTIEDMLERPVDMYKEFKDILQFSDENGNPISLSDLETRIRKAPEWQGTKNAELEAREVATLIAQEFGMVKY